MKIYDIGPLLTHTLKLQRTAPLLHWATTNELEVPYRTSRSLVVRLWPSTRALVLGWWRQTGRTEEEGLGAALRTGSVSEEAPEFSLQDIRDMDDEYEIMDTR